MKDACTDWRAEWWPVAEMQPHSISPQLLHTAWKSFSTNSASSHSHSHQFSQQKIYNKTLCKDSKATTAQLPFSEMSILLRNSKTEIQMSETLPFKSKPLLKLKLFSASQHRRQLSRHWAFTSSVLYRVTATWSCAFFKPKISFVSH